jgi:hypothetical protein
VTEADDLPSIGKVYDAISEVRTDVAVIKSKIGDLPDHEQRIRSLERRSWSLAGFATIAGAALSQFVTRIFQ